MNHARTIGEAIAIASHWINESDLTFQSAFIGGSVAYAEPESLFDPVSDIDCYLVVAGDPPDGKIGKIPVNGVLLDVSWLPWNQLEFAGTHAVLASLLHFGKVVRDPDGTLTTLKNEIGNRFASEDAITQRLADMRSRVRVIAADPAQLAEPEMVMNWLFPATLVTHIPLIAACAPLTVRKRFVASKRVMEPEAYEQLLALYGFADVTQQQAQAWLNDTTTLFDHAAAIAADSARFWSSDITSDARVIAIGGSQQLIDAGLHREALYWIIATQIRCLTVMNDTGVDTGPFVTGFRAMTGALGIETTQQRRERSHAILAWIDAYESPY